jgi:uncharacterized protein YjiS (DUF1127 family)
MLIRFYDMGPIPIMSTGDIAQEASMSDRSISIIRIGPLPGTFRALAAGSWARVRAMLRARQTRQMLGEMDDRMLADIGVGRGDALVESSKPMWDVETRLY